MDLAACLEVLNEIRGCTFASLDAVTYPFKGVKSIRKETVSERVLLFKTKGDSGYEAMVRRRLEQEGKDPGAFVVGDLPFGERVDNLPLIVHHGLHYLQTVLLRPGSSRYYLGEVEVQPFDLGISVKEMNGQGLNSGNEVLVHTYRLENIRRLRLLGEDLP